MPGSPHVGARARGASARRVALFVAASAALIALPAVPAWAHNYLVATTPADGAVVSEQPGTISLETNDELLDVGDGSAIRVQGPDGRYYGDGCTEVVGATAEARAELGITEGMIRFSAGLEHADDLIEDLYAALEKA